MPADRREDFGRRREQGRRRRRRRGMNGARRIASLPKNSLHPSSLPKNSLSKNMPPAPLPRRRTARLPGPPGRLFAFADLLGSMSVCARAPRSPSKFSRFAKGVPGEGAASWYEPAHVPLPPSFAPAMSRLACLSPAIREGTLRRRHNRASKNQRPPSCILPRTPLWTALSWTAHGRVAKYDRMVARRVRARYPGTADRA